MKPLAFALLTCLFSSCTNHTDQRVAYLPFKIVVDKPQFPSQRFVSTNSADIAFDTKSGALCRTWDWSDPDGTPYGRGLGSQPMCARLYLEDQQEEAQRTYALQRANELAEKSRAK